jgi:hypothetical protein
MTTQKPSEGPQNTSIKEEATVTPKKKRGRPTKAATDIKKVGNRGKVGRPKGDAAVINEYKARMLASPKSGKVLEAIFNAALDDEHKGQQAAWKLIMDRIAPTAAFEKDVIKDAGRSAIQINITGVGSTEVSSDPLGSSEALEGQWTTEES